MLVDYRQSSCTVTPAKDNKMASHTSTTQHPFAVIVPIKPPTASIRRSVIHVDFQKSSCTSTPVTLKDNKMASHTSTTQHPFAVIVPMTPSQAFSRFPEQQVKVISSPTVKFKDEADPGTGNHCEEKVDDEDDAANFNEEDSQSCMLMRWTTGKHNDAFVEGADNYSAVLTSTELGGSTAPPVTGDAEDASQDLVWAEGTDCESLETPFLQVLMHPLTYTSDIISLFFSFVTCCRCFFC
jgi:hypothetical protein